MLQNPSNPASHTSSPKAGAPKRYDLDLLALQKIDSDLLRGRLVIKDARRVRLACSFIFAALREMEHAVAAPVPPDSVRDLLA